MTPDNDAINARLNALVADFRNQLPERLQSIEQNFTVVRQNRTDFSALKALYLALHKLAGSGATFGYTELGRRAREWETMLHPLIQSQTAPTVQKCDEMHCFLKQLLQAATTPDEN